MEKEQSIGDLLVRLAPEATQDQRRLLYAGIHNYGYSALAKILAFGGNLTFHHPQEFQDTFANLQGPFEASSIHAYYDRDARSIHLPNDFTPYAIAHEYAHLFDHSLDDISTNDMFSNLYLEANNPISPYASMNSIELFAEESAAYNGFTSKNQHNIDIDIQENQKIREPKIYEFIHDLLRRELINNLQR